MNREHIKRESEYILATGYVPEHDAEAPPVASLRELAKWCLALLSEVKNLELALLSEVENLEMELQSVSAQADRFAERINKLGRYA